MSNVLTIGVSLTFEQVENIDQHLAHMKLDGDKSCPSRSAFIRRAIDVALAARAPRSARFLTPAAADR